MFPEILPDMALMVAVPAATAVTSPPLLTVATDVSDDLQVTCVLISWLVPSEYVPVAVKSLEFPAATLELAGVTDIEDSKGVTVRVMFPETPPAIAVIVAVPAETPVASPLPLTVATDVLDEPQVTCVAIL